MLNDFIGGLTVVPKRVAKSDFLFKGHMLYFIISDFWDHLLD